MKGRRQRASGPDKGKAAEGERPRQGRPKHVTSGVEERERAEGIGNRKRSKRQEE